MGGRVGKVTYSAYYNKRSSDGYRKNAETEAEAYFGQISWKISAVATLRAELAHSKYRFQLPGPLTDAMFHADRPGDPGKLHL